MGKDKKTTTTSNQSGTQYGSNQQSNYGGFNNQGFQGLDPASQGYVDWQRMLGQQGANTALGAQFPGLPPSLAALANGAFGLGGGGMGGFGGGGGGVGGFNPGAGISGALDPSSFQGLVQQYMNPYVQGVVDPTRAEFGQLRDLARRDSDDAAIRAGAFGGSGAAVERGVRLGELDRAQGSQIANLMSQGYSQAQAAALQEREAKANASALAGGSQAALSAQQLAAQDQAFRQAMSVFGLQRDLSLDPTRAAGTALQYANMGLGPTGSTYGQSGTQYGNQSGTQQGGFNQTGSQTSIEKGNLWKDLVGGALTFGPMLFGAPPGSLGGGGKGGGLKGGPQQIPYPRGGGGYGNA